MGDWNWFFSALAQSAAAIIGILAVFTVSKLMNESERVALKMTELNELFQQHTNIVNRLNNIAFDWMNTRTIEDSHSLKDLINDGTFDSLNTEEREALLHQELSLYYSEKNLECLNKRIYAINQHADKTIRAGFFQIPYIPSEQHTIHLRERLDRERDKAETLKLDAEYLIDKFTCIRNIAERDQNRTRSLVFTLWLLLFGVLLTVVYPLHFLPLQPNVAPSISLSLNNFIEQMATIKGVLLCFLGAFFTSLIVFLLKQSKRISSDYKRICKCVIDEYTELDQYCTYFREPPRLNGGHESK